MSGFNSSPYQSSAPAQSKASSPSPFSAAFGLPSASPNPSSGFAFSLNSAAYPSSSSTLSPLFGGASSGTAPSFGFGLSSYSSSASCPAFGSLSLSSAPSLGASLSPVTFEYPPVKEEPRSGSPAGTATRSDFDGIAISAEKAAILGNIKRKHPSCFSSLRLQSESHRRSAYDHLVKVIEELKAVGGKGGPDSYNKVLIWLDDLEIYGFDMGWLRDDVVKLRRRRMEVAAEKEARRKAREELVKQIEAIDAELAAAAKDDDAAAAPEFLSDLFGA